MHRLYAGKGRWNTLQKSPLCACLYKVSDFEFASQSFLLNVCLTLLPNESKETSVSSTKYIEHIITVEVQGKKL